MHRKTTALLSGLILFMTILVSACGADSPSRPAADGPRPRIVIGAIPDQDPEILARNYELLADYLATELDADVSFRPVTDYRSAVTAFRVGDLQLVWFGGLTGVQARLQVEGARAIAQRDIDREFTSVFIASTDSNLPIMHDVADLVSLAGRSFTFGPESSTSGRLMPQSFLAEAGLGLDSFNGEVGFSGSHDQTIALVEAGTYEAGVLNSQVWRARVAEGRTDTSRVRVILETPTYHDYHWVARPELGPEMERRIVKALTDLDPASADEAEILDFFGAKRFVTTTDADYAEIEQVGRDIGKITG